jgi:hypothetical protein
VEKLRAEAEQALAAADKAHSEEATRLRRISKKTAEELEEAQLQLKAARERLGTLELSEQQALRELAVATAQLDSLQSKGVVADSAITENAELKQVREGVCVGTVGYCVCAVAWWVALHSLRLQAHARTVCAGWSVLELRCCRTGRCACAPRGSGLSLALVAAAAGAGRG